jgi:hydroxyethylthiazole kinase
MGALAAALAAVSSSPLQAAISVAVLMGVSGELAFEKAPRPGSFAVALLDCIYELTTEQIQEKANICCFNN